MLKGMVKGFGIKSIKICFHAKLICAVLYTIQNGYRSEVYRVSTCIQNNPYCSNDIIKCHGVCREAQRGPNGQRGIHTEARV